VSSDSFLEASSLAEETKDGTAGRLPVRPYSLYLFSSLYSVYIDMVAYVKPVHNLKILTNEMIRYNYQFEFLL